MCLKEKNPLLKKQNISSAEREAIKDLKSKQDNIVIIAIVLLNRPGYIAEAGRQSGNKAS